MIESLHYPQFHCRKYFTTDVVNFRCSLYLPLKELEDKYSRNTLEHYEITWINIVMLKRKEKLMWYQENL